MSTDPANHLARAIAATMASIRGAAPTGRNTHAGYNYASDNDLIRACRDAMVEHQLVLYPWRMEELGTPGHSILRVEWVVTAAGVADQLVLTTIGEGKDKQDKAAYKAMTGARKYALRLLFHLPTDDDAERDDTPSKPAPEPKPEPPASASPKAWAVIERAYFEATGIPMATINAWTIERFKGEGIATWTKDGCRRLLADLKHDEKLALELKDFAENYVPEEG